MTTPAQPPTHLKKRIEDAFAVARKVVESGRQAMPAFITERGDGSIAIYMTPWQSAEEKSGMLKALALIFALREVRNLIMVGEAWVVTRKTPPGPDSPLPSQCDDRQEQLMVTGVWHGGAVVAFGDIRSEGSGVRTCSDLAWLYGGEIRQHGFQHLLPPERSSPIPFSPEEIDNLEQAALDAAGLRVENAEL